ncbi:hypothetical protein IHE55_18180 [Streptomyces pactum]|uniref:Transposase n=1 Tax=Streptomyces pactum TaxID=68249 RepID=A0ABS0NN16_9ACTN|nr:hypothetical protein [Streptomyces pactum]MBH5336599.1 hypothetical protein [Streptomyces pactum]
MTSRAAMAMSEEMWSELDSVRKPAQTRVSASTVQNSAQSVFRRRTMASRSIGTQPRKPTVHTVTATKRTRISTRTAGVGVRRLCCGCG